MWWRLGDPPMPNERPEQRRYVVLELEVPTLLGRGGGGGSPRGGGPRGASVSLGVEVCFSGLTPRLCWASRAPAPGKEVEGCNPLP